MEYSLIPRAETVREVLALNRETARYGLTLTAEQAAALTQTQRQALRDTGRIQFRSGTLERLIALFCGSPYIGPGRVGKGASRPAGAVLPAQKYAGGNHGRRGAHAGHEGRL